ncbi:magnesium chelatase subunit D [Histidinibacterium aquaticum]|uniref:Magnesium chelatase subunit D n=1 Tax=Histidinibacterium aquaticum TaxID=2613962 RepID=A0A5J5GF28_9RHOB|nr:magnesium chelatase subunit D [Histidinibacterium aquaticum]KAA9006839.1 magnesium chelatase subunit D [Histidinibacterium aquaticum]
MPDLACPVRRAALAIDLLAIDPGLGGLVLRARQGPVRQAVLDRLYRLPLPHRRLHPQTTDETLFGGLDVEATLGTGRVTQRDGLLSSPSTLVLGMAERAPPALAARLATALDGGAGHILVALDEGIDEESCAAALCDRAAFHVDLDGVSPSDLPDLEDPDLTAARARLSATPVTVDLHRQMAELGEMFGIESLRGPLFAIRAARAVAALQDVPLGTEQVEIAVALTFAHRATRLPETQDQQEAEPEEQESREETDASDGRNGQEIPQELLIEATRALVTPDLLDRARIKAMRGATGSGSGAVRKGNRRGRPLPSRPGQLGSGARVDLVATLRAAAPWQPLRRLSAPDRTGLQIRPPDIRLRRYEDRSDRLIIFAVDASGSAALARLGEAKGAIEILLSQAYARRDHVSLVAFRGSDAETLLAPTRSLVRTKRHLADLPGGGGTPLAAGLRAAIEEALAAKRRGLAPTVCILTDGRANVALDGTANRRQASTDAIEMGRLAMLNGIEALVLDCGVRPEQSLKSLAQAMGAPYLPLPRANAERVSNAVSAALRD